MPSTRAISARLPQALGGPARIAGAVVKAATTRERFGHLHEAASPSRGTFHGPAQLERRLRQSLVHEQIRDVQLHVLDVGHGRRRDPASQETSERARLDRTRHVAGCQVRLRACARDDEVQIERACGSCVLVGVVDDVRDVLQASHALEEVAATSVRQRTERVPLFRDREIGHPLIAGQRAGETPGAFVEASENLTSRGRSDGFCGPRAVAPS
jgi:hypothetical protein